MNAGSLFRSVSFLTVVPTMLNAQAGRRDPVALQHWPAPLYWQPQAAEPAAASATANPNPLILIAMTPCRVVDTRASQAFPPPFGPPSLGGGSRTFPFPSSTACSIPAAAQAYSLNVTVVPSTPAGFITAYPTGQALPLAATLVWSGGSLTSNAAIVPAGTSGSMDVYASSTTDLVIDINGYYAPAGSVSTGTANTALGAAALSSNTTGFNNTAVGMNALQSNTTGDGSVAFGANSLASNTTGVRNTAAGYDALGGNTTGGNNTAAGIFALSGNTTGSSGAAFGAYALQVGGHRQGRGDRGAGLWDRREIGRVTMKACSCGSGKLWWRLSDARGIYLSRVCAACETRVKARYRPEISPTRSTTATS